MQNQNQKNHKIIEVTVEQAISKKTNEPYEYINVVVGDWDYRIFPDSKFDLKYVKAYLADEQKTTEK